MANGSAPCHMCADRHYKCHSECEKYKEYRNYMDEYSNYRQTQYRTMVVRNVPNRNRKYSKFWY